jgi:UDP-glucose 4-epimerase
MKEIILLTGGLGYIGSHAAVALIEGGYEAVLVDNLCNTRIEVLDGIERITGVRPVFERVDLREQRAVVDLCARHTFGGCIHFAALKAVGESVEQPLEYYENNVVGLVHLLRQWMEKRWAGFIFSSSCTVYGQADVMPIAEGAPVRAAESPYGNTKQIGEQILRDCVVAYPDFNAITLRYFNPIGAHESAEIGELPLGVPMNLVPFITQTAIGIRKQLKVFGNDYPTPDGTPVRDYIHVVDLARAHVVALNRLIQKSNADRFEAFNLGTGRGSSVLEAIGAFEKATGEKVNWAYAPRRPGDVVQAYADVTKANQVLGWKSSRTIEDAMRDAWRWEKRIRGQ